MTSPTGVQRAALHVARTRLGLPVEGWELTFAVSDPGQVSPAEVERELSRIAGQLPAACDQCGDAGWVRIKGKVTGAIGGYETAVECQACNPDGRVPYAGLPEFYDVSVHHLAHQTPPGVFDPNCPACREGTP